MESPNTISVLFMPNNKRLNKGGERRAFQAVHQRAAGIPRPINVPSRRKLKSPRPSPMADQQRTNSGIRIGNESFFMSASEWLAARLMTLTSSRQNPPA